MAHFLAKLCGVYVSSHVGTHMNLFFFGIVIYHLFSTLIP